MRLQKKVISCGICVAVAFVWSGVVGAQESFVPAAHYSFSDDDLPQDAESDVPLSLDADSGLSDELNLNNTAPCGTCSACQSGSPNKTCCLGCEVDWSKVPFSISKMPRPGMFRALPNSPGYYSAWDCLRGNCQEKRPTSGYPALGLMPPSFFDADFRYVDAKDPADRTLAEMLKRIQLNDCMMFSTGGNAWIRYMKEQNSRLTEVENSYALTRARVFGDLMVGDCLRVYGEFLWADNLNSELPPLPIDENLGDILNLFVDVNLFEWEDHPVVVRAGRQELLLGSQRLVSTLDWANTRRTFEGVRAFRKGEKWDVDAFWTQYVPPRTTDIDRADWNLDFMGAWLTYRPKKGEFVDFYYLYANNDYTIAPQGIPLAPSETNTFGMRWAGDHNGMLWDVEGAYQFGDRAGHSQSAGAGTAGLGRSSPDLPGNPTAWIYYDYASGDSEPGVGSSNTFNQLYPFGHYYMGWADLVGRQNIHDANAHLFFYPTPWTTVWCQYHHFWLAESQDALYNAGGAPIRRDATGQAGRNVGDEIDIVVNFHLAQNTDFLFGYSKLFGGGFLEGTSGPNRAADSELLFFQYQLRW